MRIAVVGGGLFGCTAAVYAARAGHNVHLFEARPSLMCGASRVTFARLHRGAHYPRDAATGRECRAAEAEFRAEYGDAVISGGQQFYIIPENGSHFSPQMFRQFLEAEGFWFQADGNRFQVDEPRIHLDYLRFLVECAVADAGVTVFLETRPSATLLHNYDKVIIAAYSGLNDVLASLRLPADEYRFQVVERIAARLPDGMFAQPTSIVVADGPFGCLDPLDDGERYIVGHVVHTSHATNTGHAAVVPEHIAPYLGRTGFEPVPFTRQKEVISDLARYIPGLADAQYDGSDFVVRAVPAYAEATDRRPTLVRAVNDHVVTIFSGKLGTAVRAAKSALALAEGRSRMAA